jgi:hypothetical protein
MSHIVCVGRIKDGLGRGGLEGCDGNTRLMEGSGSCTKVVSDEDECD